MRMVASVLAQMFNLSSIYLVAVSIQWCRYNGEVNKKLVKVSVDGQTSNAHTYGITRIAVIWWAFTICSVQTKIPLNDYSISLTLNPNPTVTINLKATLLIPIDSPNHDMHCVTIANTLVNATSKAISVTVGGNHVDEGTGAIFFNVKLRTSSYLLILNTKNAP